VAYVGGPAGLAAVDVSNPQAPLLLGTYDTSGAVRGVAVSGTVAVLSGAVAGGANGIVTVDVSDPTAMTLLGTLGGLTSPQGVVSDGSYAYLADYTGSLATIDIRNPAAPTLLARETSSLGGILLDVAKVGSFTFGADIFFVNGVPISNVSVPSNPQVATRLDFPARDDNGTGIAADGQFVYLAAGRGLTRPGTTGDTRLYIGQYLQITDAAGIAPTVSIQQPLPGATVAAGRTVKVHAEASDDLGVSAVIFSVDGVPVYTAGSAPYDFFYKVPLDATTVTFTATAVDFGNNQGQSSAVTILAHPNSPPQVTFTSPDPGSSPLERTPVTVAVTASDADGAVSKVQFAVNGRVVGTKLAPPYQTTFLVPTGVSSIDIVARAVDDLGGSTDVTMTLPVVFNPAPPAPEASLIDAGVPTNGVSTVTGQAGAAPMAVNLRATNDTTGQSVTVPIAADGSFALGIAATAGDILSLVSINAGGLASPAVSVPVGGAVIGARLWLQADKGVVQDASNRVSSWADQSGNGANATQAVVASQPIWVDDVVGGHPVLRFDGSNDFVQFPALNQAIRTVFWVVAESDTATASYRSLLGHGSFRDFEGDYGTPGAIWRNGIASSRVTGGQTRVNGVPVDGGVTPRPREMAVISLVTTDVTSADRFGTNPMAGSAWWGDLAELIVFDRALGADEVRTVEQYLMSKYQIADTVTPPRVHPAGGLFQGSALVSLSDGTSGAEIRYTLDGSDPSLGSPLYTQPFTLTHSATVRAKAFAAGLTDSATTTVGFTSSAETNPMSIQPDHLLLWLRSDAGVPSGAGDFWMDQSPHAAHAVQPASRLTPRLVDGVVNGLPAMRFDGANDFVQLAAMNGQIRTVFWVVAEDPAAPAGYRSLLGHGSFRDFEGDYGTPGAIWRNGIASSWVTGGHTRMNGAPVDGTVVKRPTSMAVVSLVTTDVTSADRFGTNPLAGSAWFGDLAELVIYDRALTDTEVQSIEQYLLNKYALNAVAAVPVTSSPGGIFTGSTVVTLSSGTPCSTIYYTLDGSEPTEASLLYSGPITIAQTTTLKSKAFCPNLLPSATATVGFTSSTDFTPAAIPGGNLRLWLRADAGVPSGGFGDFWADQSGNGNHGFQTSTNATPRQIPSVLNGLPVMRFNGQNQATLFTQPLNSAIRTVFWVLSENPAATTSYRSLLGHGSFRDFEGELGTPGPIWRSGIASSRVTGGQTRVNGVAVDGTVALRPTSAAVVSLVTTDVTSADRFGTNPLAGSSWWGDLAELVIYDRVLSASEIQQVEDYLTAKYRIGAAATTPVASSAGGVFTPPLDVTLASASCGTLRYTTDGTEPAADSSPYVGPITLFGTTTLKAKAFCAGLAPSTTMVVGFTSSADFNPSSLPGGNLRLWLRADAGVAAGDAGTWVNQAGTPITATQSWSTATAHRVPNVVNGLPVMRFDGAKDFVQFAPALDSEIRTVFWVVTESPDATASYRSLLGHGSFRDFEGDFGAPGAIWRNGIASARVTGGQTRVNGAPVNGTTYPRPRTLSVISLTTTDVTSADRFGTNPLAGSAWWGDLAELVVYNRVLDHAEVEAVTQYLLNKYALNAAAAVPIPSTAGGLFTGSTTVALSSGTPCSSIYYTLDGTEPTEASSLLYTGPITITQTTTLKSKAFCADLPSSPTSTVGFTNSADFNPASIPGGNLQLWLRADAGVPSGGFMDFWADQSGRANHGIQASSTATAQQVQSVVNGLPAIRFDGNGKYTQFTVPLNSVIRAAFWVVTESPDATASYRSLLGHGSFRDFEGDFGAPGAIWRSGIASARVTGGQTRVNGVGIPPSFLRPRTMSIVSLVTTDVTSADRFGTNPLAGSSWWGDLSELILYDRPLTPAEVSGVEHYLGARYGIAVP
jgi:hypothetical protein